MIIECPYCKAKVDATVIAVHESFDPREDPAPFRATLLECTICNNSILAGEELINQFGPDEEEWSEPSRLWPSPNRFLSWTIPEVVRVSLEEADRCFKGAAYTACAVMCGRALEGICRNFNTKSPYLGGGIKELLEREVIDKHLFQWSEELKKQRNIAAHATDKKISKEDAEDLLNFAIAICDYVYVLNERFQQFMKRRDTEANDHTRDSSKSVIT